MNRKWLATPYMIWIVGFIVIPLIFIFGRAFSATSGGFTTENVIAIFSPIHRKALILSLETAFITTLLCIILAYPLALILRNSKMKQSSMVLIILILPMWMNFILRILALQMILSNNGILNFILSSFGLKPLQIINTKYAIILGMVYDFLPYMILPIMNSILAIDKNYIEAAKDLGANKYQVFLKIIFPLSLPGVGSGITMVFVPSMTAFVVSNILGGGKTLLLGNVIEQEFMTSMNWNLGSGLSVALMCFILITSFVFGNNDDADGGRMLW